MGLTKALSSKANIKQGSAGDFPIIPKQPAIARLAAESTANQTVINLGFQVDTVNAPDSFLLSVDGKLLTPGSSNDYVFSAIDSFGFSSTVTLQVPIAAGLNIQAIKLGLKKEVEFIQDARFSDVYESNDQSFQGFIRTADLMIATPTSGSPAPGSFYSSISNRQSIPDLTKDLKVRMGVERMTVQSIFQIPNEIGPSGEPVYGLANDQFNQVRFVGSGISNSNSSNGANVTSNTVNDFVEITFFGTGLNLLSVNNNVWDARATVDGGTEGSNFMPSGSTVINGRNYSPNSIIPVISALSLGVHTVKIRNNSASGLNFNGFEIINDVSTLKVNSGVGYVGSKKLSLNGQQSPAYNSGFESGTLGTKGGRVITYLKSDGTFGKAVQPTDASSLTSTSANHQNEEIARIYNFREFGSGRADDFSLLTSASSARIFTLEDGTTTLIGNAVRVGGSPEGIYQNSNGDFVTLTFVGTGLDVQVTDSASGGADSFTFQIDGAAGVAWPYTAGVSGRRQTVKIASGLPYGTHTVRFNRVSAATWIPYLNAFVVYQPKKPSLPLGAIELADYNIMANYVSVTSAATGFIGTGTLRKAVSVREAVYTAAWGTALSDATAYESGQNTSVATAGATLSYSFFGTGFEWVGKADTGVVNNSTLSVDGSSNLSIYTTSLFQASGGATFTPSTGVLGGTNSATQKLRVTVSGLPLGFHTMKWTMNTTAGFYSDCLDIITPIHSYKNNSYIDVQNTLPVGSCAISDNRKTSAIKDINLQPKAWSQAVGVSSSPTTTSTSLVPMPDMLCTVKTSGGDLKITYSAIFINSGAQANVFAIYINGLPVASKTIDEPVIGSRTGISDILKIKAAAGTYKVDIYWRGNGATLTADGTSRTLLIEET